MSAQAGLSPSINFDALSPRQVAERMEKAGVDKANLQIWTMFALAVLAGSFIGLGGELSTLTVTGIDIGFGLTKLIGGLVFSLGLVLVVVAGAELFTGNNLLTIAWISGAVSSRKVLRNWSVVFVGNLVGSLALAGMMYATGQWAAADYAVGATALSIAAGKVMLPFTTALARGVLCNALVCLAVWLCFSARSVTDKIMAIVFPITAFVASGFEHSIANMYFIPYGLMLSTQPEVVAAAGLGATQMSHLTLLGFLGNLIPVTIGNLIGGGIMVGGMYWFIYLRGKPREEVAAESVPLREALALPEGIKMVTTVSESRTPLSRYVIATADAFYAEVNERMVYIDHNSEGEFHICAETPTVGSASAVDLSQVLLEYGMTCAAQNQGSLSQAYRKMDIFGKRLGESIAIRIIRNMPAETTLRRAAYALKGLFESLDVPYALEQTDEELSYNLDLCPLCQASERSGLLEVELGHHGLSALLRSLVGSLSPELGIRLPSNIDEDHVISVQTPVETEEMAYL